MSDVKMCITFVAIEINRYICTVFSMQKLPKGGCGGSTYI